MQNNIVETLIGAAVVVVAVVFFIFAYNTSDAGGVSRGYPLQAEFDTAAGVTVGTDVRIAGIKVGTVTDLTLANGDFRPTVRMRIDGGTRIPKDSYVDLASESLLGGTYVRIYPGASEELIDQTEGGEISFAQKGGADIVSLLNDALSGSASKPIAEGYPLWAEVNNVVGVKPGTEVRVAGVPIGVVTGVTLNKEIFVARIDMRVQKSIELPLDSSLKVSSESLLGGTYISISPGGDLENFDTEKGGQIQFAQGSVDLMSLISQAVFGAGSGSGSGSGN